MLRWLWIPVFLIMIAACFIGVVSGDLEEIIRNAVVLCLSCIGIG